MNRLGRWVLRGVSLLLVLGAVAFGLWQLWREPNPDEILARLDVPNAPALTPEEEQATFRLAPGFRIELVAAEPLVVDPVAMDWDDEGRLYAVEMRGFMATIDGDGEEQPVGRIVVLEDTDGDGRMDRSDVFLDELVLPRAIAVLPQGVRIGAPPDLLLCRDTTGDRRCDQRTRLLDYAAVGENPEHQENGLLAGLDGWIYNAKSSRRFRLRGRSIESEETVFRGQWGIAQDDEGRLFYNHNSAFLYGDAIPAETTLRQPATAASPHKIGVNVPLADGAEVFGIRVAPGLNRAYLSGTLRPDGRQRGPTAVSGLAIQRGDQFGPEFVGDAFVPEAGGSAVAHFSIERDGLRLRAEHRLYDDPTWGRREFLASTDERFRPVDADFGPDGAIWLIDMYRGVIQHARFVSDHLRRYVLDHELEPPGATGRIWRIVRDDRALQRVPPPLETVEQWIAGLDHPNGWVRDRAQRRLIAERPAAAVAALRNLATFSPLGRRHALLALVQMGSLDGDTWRRALRDPAPLVRIVALRQTRAFARRADSGARDAVTSMLDDADPTVRVGVLLALGDLPAATRPLDTLLAAGREGDPIANQAVLSGLSGLERRALDSELERTSEIDPKSATLRWIEQLTAAAHLAARDARRPQRALRGLLDRIGEIPVEWQRLAALRSIDATQRLPGSNRIELAGPHPLFDPERKPEFDDDSEALIARIRRHFTWPGDPTPGGARPLTEPEAALREQGGELFEARCAACHGADGRGLASLAPSLVASPWVRDADDWIVRIVLHGLTGPLRIDGETWNATMPGHGHDPVFDDEAIAGLVTHLRRSWGHAESPLEVATVAQIRAATQNRRDAWRVDELLDLEVEHRLDRYVGLYTVPIIGIGMEVKRSGSTLTVGVPHGPSGPLTDAGDGLFTSSEVSLQFTEDESGTIDGASAVRDGTRFPLSRSD